MDRKGPRINTKELLSNDRQQHAPEISSHCQGIKYYGCVDATVLKQDRLWEPENSLWENDHHKENLWRSDFDLSLASAHILPEVFHPPRFLLSNKYPYGKMLFQNNKEAIKKVNVHHRKNKAFHLFWPLKGLQLA